MKLIVIMKNEKTMEKTTKLGKYNDKSNGIINRQLPSIRVRTTEGASEREKKQKYILKFVWIGT